jgi:outer membrane protein TolC
VICPVAYVDSFKEDLGMKIFAYLCPWLLFIPKALPHTPSQLVQLVQDRAPLVKIFAEEQNASEAAVNKARTLANPFLTFQGGELRTAGQRGGVLDLTLMQPLPWPGKRTQQVRGQEFLRKIAELNLEEVKMELAHRIFLLCWELASETAIESHNQERRERFAFISRYLTTRPLASPKESLEKDLILSQLRVVEKSMNEASARRRGLEKELQILTGLSEVKVEVDWSKLPSPHETSRYLKEYSESISFKKMQEEKKISENNIESARLEARPDILVGVNYRQENVNPSNQFYHGQVSLVIPLIDRGQHSVQRARAELRKTEAQLLLLEHTTRTEISYLIEQMVLAKKNLEVFPLSLQVQSESRFHKALDAFRKGQIDVMTFLQSDTQVHDNIHHVFSSRLAYLTTLSQLERKLAHLPESH